MLANKLLLTTMKSQTALPTHPDLLKVQDTFYFNNFIAFIMPGFRKKNNKKNKTKKKLGPFMLHSQKNN